MATLNNKAVIPKRMDSDSGFKFRCHPGISCFTKCCSNIDILLTPYDVVRLKQRLGVSSTTFLAEHTRFEIDTKTTHPLLFLKMNDDEERLCPFVKAGEGCTIYEDRPAACRYYPVGQATHRIMDEQNETPVHDEWYVLVKEDHCAGFEEDRAWTIAEWRDDQGCSLYDEMNREWKNIMMKQDIPRDKVEEKRQKMFYMASYDLDSFRRYVLESRFLEIFDVGPRTLEKIKNDDAELLRFAVRYLKYVFGIQAELDLNSDVKEEQIHKLEQMRSAEDEARARREAEIQARDGNS